MVALFWHCRVQEDLRREVLADAVVQGGLAAATLSTAPGRVIPAEEKWAETFVGLTEMEGREVSRCKGTLADADAGESRTASGLRNTLAFFSLRSPRRDLQQMSETLFSAKPFPIVSSITGLHHLLISPLTKTRRATTPVYIPAV